MHPVTTPLAAAAAFAIAVLVAAPAAHAARATAPAISSCQAALPVFEGLIRKRPLAVQNEGDAAAFVTCGLENAGPNGGTHRINFAEVQLQNQGSLSRSVSCTAVNSNASASPGAPAYLNRTVAVAPGATVTLDFQAAQFPGNPLVLTGNTLAVSCNLPPGIGITSTVLQNNAA